MTDIQGHEEPGRREYKKVSEQVIEWIETTCRIPEGKGVGDLIVLPKFMRDDLRAIYDNPAGTRRAIISRGRKNAKTTECALILLVHLCGPKFKRNSELYSTATARDQAAIIFDKAAKMIRMSPKLREQITVRDTAKQLLYPAGGVSYRALSADASTAFGLNPALAIHDELGQQRGSRSQLYEAIETAVGAQEEPLSVIISTQAPSDGDLLSVLIDDAREGHDPRTVLRFQSADLKLDPFSDKAIKAANPAFDIFMNRKEVRAMAKDAKRMPSREAEYRNLVLNQRVEAVNPFIDRTTWETCKGEVWKDWGKAPVFGGLDLSAVNDLTALVLIANIAGVWQVKPVFWLPEEGLRERSRLDHVPYDIWKNQGYVTVTPGKAIEYEFVAQDLNRIMAENNIKKIAFDRWGFAHLKQWLTRAGFREQQIDEKFIEFGQGYKSMSPALRTLESMVLSKKLAHANNPVLAMCANNSRVTTDPAGGRKLDKSRSRGRIDGMVALAMAASIAETDAPDKSFRMAFV